MQNFLMTMNDETDALRKIDIVGKLSPKKSEPAILSFPKYLNYELGMTTSIQKFSYINNVFVVPSCIVKTNNDERLLITNPNVECTQMIQKIKTELFLFVGRLVDACKKMYSQIKIKNIITYCNNTMGYNISYDDMASYMYNVIGKGETIAHVSSYLKSVVDCVELPSMKDLLFNLPSEDVWFIHPVDKVSKYFKGIVVNHDTCGDVIDYHIDQGKEIIHGDPTYLVM